MNEYIFYTIEGYTCPPKEDKKVENCQVLGRSMGNNIEEAKKKLLYDNSWIIECGFDIDEATCVQLVTDATRSLMKQRLEEIEYVISLLNEQQLEKFDKWLLQKNYPA